jgi:hypothetical protein
MTNEQLRGSIIRCQKCLDLVLVLPSDINLSMRRGIQVIRSYPFAGTKHDGDHKEDCGRERGSRRKVTVRSSGFSSDIIRFMRTHAGSESGRARGFIAVTFMLQFEVHR